TEQKEKVHNNESTIIVLYQTYNIENILTSTYKQTEVLQRVVGETTENVKKEMYTFQDRGDRSITLRPEGTAGVVRAYLQNKLYGSPIQPAKLFYFMELFRYERPQQGRMRQLHQLGV